jgi:hypothetical protein
MRQSQRLNKAKLVLAGFTNHPYGDALNAAIAAWNNCISSLRLPINCKRTFHFSRTLRHLSS